MIRLYEPPAHSPADAGEAEPLAVKVVRDMIALGGHSGDDLIRRLMLAGPYARPSKAGACRPGGGG